MTPSFPTRRSSDLRPVAGGSGTARCTDGGNFFKRNSLGSGNDQAALAARPGGIAQFRGLMQILGIDPALAASIAAAAADWIDTDDRPRSEEHTSELQSLMRISYAVFCLKKNILLLLFVTILITLICLLCHFTSILIFSFLP